MNAAAALLAAALVVAGEGGAAPAAAPAESNGPRPVLAGGVLTSRLPNRRGVVSHGPEAHAFVAQTLGAGDDRVPDDRDKPWLVVVGSPSARAAELAKLPEDLVAELGTHVREFDPGDPVLELYGLERASSGVHAQVKDAAGKVHYTGLFELSTIVRVLRALLGGADPSPLPIIPIPIPGPERVPGWAWCGLSIAGVLAVQKSRRLFRACRAFVRELFADEPAGPPRPN